jgi:hypothetical protein
VRDQSIRNTHADHSHLVLKSVLFEQLQHG